MNNYISFTIAEMTTRKANFSSEEVEILVEEVGKRKEVLFAKFSAVVTNQRKKMEWQEISGVATIFGPSRQQLVWAPGQGVIGDYFFLAGPGGPWWAPSAPRAPRGRGACGALATPLQEIADRMNVVSKQVRDQKDVKKKWQGLSSSSKKKESCRRREMNKTGGGEAEYENANPMEQNVIAVIGEEAVEGIVGGFDVGLEEICSLRNEQKDEVLNVKEEIKLVVDEKVRDVVEEGLGGKSRKRKIGMERLVEIEEEKLAIKRACLLIEQRRLEIEKERFKMKIQAHQANYFVFGNDIY